MTAAVACSSDDDAGQLTQPPGSAGAAGDSANASGAGGDGQPGVGGAGGSTDQRGTIAWKACESAELRRLKGLECGTIQVPVDYTKPEAGSLEIAVSRIKARDAEHRIGVLLLNPGGPGAPALHMPYYLIGDPAPDPLARFDLVAFDPRGVGASGEIDCGVPVYANIDPKRGSDPTAADLATNAEAYRKSVEAFSQACQQKYGSKLSHFGLNAVARDMDQLRTALAEESISYLGFSYGTWLGAIYATMFPSRVRAMVLDATMTPETELPVIHRETALASELTLTHFDAACKASSNCALHDRGVIPVFEELITAAWKSPINSGVPERPITSNLLRDIMVDTLTDTLSWQDTAAVLDDIAKVQQGSGTISASTRDFLELYAEGASDASFFTILCDDVTTTRELSAVLEDAQSMVKQAPHFWDAMLDEAPCTVWPKPLDPVKISATPAADKLLLVGTVGDPSTPYAWNARLKEKLGNARTLTHEGDGHGAYLANLCATNAIDSFLIELAAPPEKCAAEPVDFEQSSALVLNGPGSNAGSSPDRLALLGSFRPQAARDGRLLDARINRLALPKARLRLRTH